MDKVKIRCPKCYWEPDNSCLWICSVCKTKWNTFETGGQCPTCFKAYDTTMCLKTKGGCGQMSPHDDWYRNSNQKQKTLLELLMFWKSAGELPVTEHDKAWTDTTLLSLAEMFDPVYFQSIPTITPRKEHFERPFNGTEEDADFIFERLAAIMNIDLWEIKLMFFTEKPRVISDRLITTPAAGLKGSWNSSPSGYVNNGLGDKEIWIEWELLNDRDGLITAMTHELAKYKLTTEHEVSETDSLLFALTALAFGFGIFMGNSYFKFSQWSNSRRQGWQMSKSGFLPEQVMAYAMAWLAHYREEDTSWKQYLNKTMKNYFEQSYRYITENRSSVKWK